MQKQTDTASSRSLDEFLSGGRTVMMLMTLVGERHTARPVTCLEAADGRLSFLVSTTTDWAAAIAEGRVGPVMLTVADAQRNTYLSLEGLASMTTDPAERARLWTSFAEAWFDGPDDPTLAVLRVDVTSGEYWDGPSGAIGRALGLLRAVVQHDGESLGQQGQVRVR